MPGTLSRVWKASPFFQFWQARLISEAHSDKVGICFGLLVSVASVVIILMAAGVIAVRVHPCEEQE